MDNRFKIKTEAFEGPMDLLLDLIEKRKLLINDVSLAKVTDDFIAHMQNREAYSIKDTSEFLVIAATLLLIKSKSLLPTLDLSEDEKADMRDLELKLKIYKKIKELSANVKNLFGADMLFFPNARKTEPVFSPDASMTAANIANAIFSVIKALPKFEAKPKVSVAKAISLEEMITNLTARVQSSLKMSFKDFSGMGKAEKVNVIVSFLAMLELVKQGIIEVEQREKFADISMETKSVGVPSYS
ncbi:MAG: segregation/condensation protein A [Patescibacteria group bacterium]|nr:segregation/condensation protein A [Patescibacteria group bacterium]MDE1945923.1 segregation/condensation protein A [Patescibacteria group bacterium]